MVLRMDPRRPLRRRYPEIILMKNESNLGFAAGNNRGMEMALHMGCDYVFLLNNDTTVDAACLSELVKAAESDPPHWSSRT